MLRKEDPMGREKNKGKTRWETRICWHVFVSWGKWEKGGDRVAAKGAEWGGGNAAARRGQP